MKDKLMILALAVALLVGLVPPSSAMANEDTGQITWLYVAEKLPDDLKSKLTDNTYVFYRVPDNSPSNAGEYYLVVREWFYATAIIINSQKLIYFKNGDSLVSSCPLYKFDVESDEWVSSGSVTGAGVQNVDMQIIASNHDCSYEHETGTLLQSGIPTYEESLGYNFKNWCFDTGLNFSASSNESSSVIPYSYNDYWHIVRKTVDGKWLLTTIDCSIGRAKMALRVSEDLGKFVIYEFSGDDSFVIDVRQYEYDTDGWRLRTYSSYGFDDLLSGLIPLNFGFGGIAYTSTDIYTSDGMALYMSASTEYVEPVIPDIVITPTPTPELSGGSGSGSGFDIVVYSSQIRAEVKVDSVYMRDKPSLQGSAVAAFIKTWDVDVLGYVYENDGTVWYYCKTMRDDMEYIGFIKAEYLAILSVVNNDFGFEDISLEDTPELIETAKNSFVELLGFVGVVPMMISAVFGFLPSWCLGIVCVAVISICIVAIIKRG